MTYAAAKVRPNSEFDLLERLEASGHEGYCPASISRLRLAGMAHTVPVRKAAWPGYLLVKAKKVEWFDGDQLIVDHFIEPNRVYEDPRFHGFLGHEDCMALISEDKVITYRDREDRGMYDPDSNGTPEFLKGDLYKVLEGPWQSMVGEVVFVQGKHVELEHHNFKYRTRIDGLLLRRHCVESRS